MPSGKRVEEFIQRMKKNESLELMTDFYTEDATQQENNDVQRSGLATLLANEQRALSLMEFERVEAPDVVVEGDAVVIHWVFDIRGPFGVRWRLDEIALQHWRGDKIARERFFYDPAQRPQLPSTKS